MVPLAALSVIVLAQASVAAPAQTAAVSAGTAQAIGWARSELHLSGWRLVSASPDLLIFAKPAPPQPGANPQVMVRGEHFPGAPQNPIGSGESFMNVGEVDCAGGRERTLHATVYSGADLQGSIIAASDEVGPWEKVGAGSAVGLEATSLCSRGEPGAPPKPPAPTSGR